VGNKRKRSVDISADEFMARHANELAESEDMMALQQLGSLFPEGVPLAVVANPSSEFQAWLREIEAAPGYRLMKELKQYWLVRLLKAAKKENNPQAYRELLEGWLIRLGVEPPEGILLRPRRSRGAPQKQSTEQIYRIWVQNDRPEWSTLAYHVYRAEYTKADAKQRKRMRDLCQRAVKRFETRDGKALN